MFVPDSAASATIQHKGCIHSLYGGGVCVCVCSGGLRAKCVRGCTLYILPVAL